MTSDELVDARLYREQRCYICLEVVPANEGTRWRVFLSESKNTTRTHFYLHSECSRRVRAQFRSPARRRLERLLPALRAMRPEGQKHRETE